MRIGITLVLRVQSVVPKVTIFLMAMAGKNYAPFLASTFPLLTFLIYKAFKPGHNSFSVGCRAFSGLLSNRLRAIQVFAEGFA